MLLAELADDVRDGNAPDVVLGVDAEIADGLEVYALHSGHMLLGILYDVAEVAVVLAGDDAADQDYGQSRRSGVFHGSQLGLEHGLAVFGEVGLLVERVEAEIGRRDAALTQAAAEVLALRQLHAVGVELYEAEAEVPRKGGQLHDVLPHRRFAAAELDGGVLAGGVAVVPHQALALCEVRLVQALLLVPREADRAAHVAAVRRHERGGGGFLAGAVGEGGSAERALHLRLRPGQGGDVHASEVQPAQIRLFRLGPDERAEPPVLRAGLVHVYPVRVLAHVRINGLEADGANALRLVDQFSLHIISSQKSSGSTSDACERRSPTHSRPGRRRRRRICPLRPPERRMPG